MTKRTVGIWGLTRREGGAAVAVLALGLFAADAVVSSEPAHLMIVRKSAHGLVPRAQVEASLAEGYADAGVKRVRALGGWMEGFEILETSRGELDQAIDTLRNHPWIAIVGAERTYSSFVEFRGAAPAESVESWLRGVFQKPILKAPPIELRPGRPDPKLSEERAYGVRNTRAVEAWKVTPGDREVVVAVTDSGIDYNHEDLALNLWRNPSPGPSNDLIGYDFVKQDGLPWDDHQTMVRGHGTHVSGIVGAVGQNGVGISGVAQKVSLMTLKIMNSENKTTNARAIEAFGYAADHGARAINASWGGYGYDAKEDPLLEEAVRRLEQAGILLIASAGNSGDNNDTSSRAAYPASFSHDNIISVTGTDLYDERGRYFSYGRTSVDVGAPGFDVLSTAPNNGYQILSGTSQAAPFVTGAVAMVYAAHPNWDWRTAKRAILETVDPVRDLKDRTVSGGRLNVLRAIQFQP